MKNRHDITEILLKVALNTIKQTNKQNEKPMKFLTKIVVSMYICSR